jgi:hypothetical protein
MSPIVLPFRTIFASWFSEKENQTSVLSFPCIRPPQPFLAQDAVTGVIPIGTADGV